jgi:outer membrane receptor protein involved in Fe transport
LRRMLAACALLLLVAAPARAQRTTGGIVGVVKDATGAVLPGVSVSVEGPNIVGSQTTTTNEQGYYRFINLPPGDYDLSYAMSSFRSVRHRGLRIGLGTTIEENATLEVSQLEEAIDVVGEAPVVDTTSNEVGTNYDRDWVANAPLRRFSFFDLVASAPGSLQGSDNVNAARTMVFGSSYDENSFQLDGVEITDAFFNEALAEPNVDAIEEVEVLSLGAPAEYGNLTGAVYNIVTRQGTNEFHGDANYFYQGDGLTSDNSKNIVNPDGSFLDACPNGGRCPYTRDKYNDFTAQLGGPLIKDKLWFFASYQYQRDDYFGVGIDNTIPLNAIRGKTNRFLGKLNWQISPNHKLVATFHLDDKTTDNGLDLNSAPSTAWTRKSNTPTPGLGYTGVLSDKTVLEVRYSGFYGSVSGGPTDPKQPRDLPRFYDIDTGFISGGHYYWYENEPRRTTVTAKVSHLADNFLGASHDFRFGVQYSDALARGLYGYNDLIFTYSQTYPEYGYGYERQPFSYSGNSRNIGAFLDDTVRVNDRLSLNLGLRYDHNKAFSAQQDELDQFGRPTGTTFPETDLFTWNSVSPRLGFNLKLTGDGRTVLKGHWGRYHRAIATGEFANVIGPNVKPIFAGGYDVPSGQFLDLTFVKGSENLGVDPGYKSPYTDQIILSLERELVRGLGAQLHYVHKRGRDYAGWRDITGQYVQVPFVDAIDGDPTATGNTLQLYQLVSDPAGRQFRITNRDELDTSVNAVSLGILKHMTRNWQLTGSATWLRAEGGLQEGQGGAGEQGAGVGIIQRGGLQFRSFGQNPNSLVNVHGRLKSDVEWQFKAQVLYKLPAGFLVAANISNRSGAHLIRRTRVPSSVTNIPEGTVVILQPRGENGRLKSVTLVDMRLQKEFRLGDKAALVLSADALNLFNASTTQTVQSSRVETTIFWYPAEPLVPRRVMLGAKLRF